MPSLPVHFYFDDRIQTPARLIRCYLRKTQAPVTGCSKFRDTAEASSLHRSVVLRMKACGNWLILSCSHEDNSLPWYRWCEDSIPTMDRTYTCEQSSQPGPEATSYTSNCQAFGQEAYSIIPTTHTHPVQKQLKPPPTWLWLPGAFRRCYRSS